MAKKNDVDEIISAYMKKGFDFGFSGVDEIPLKTELKTKTANIEEQASIIEDLKRRLTTAEELVAPLLVNLLKTADSPNIHWPNRKEQLEDLIKKFFNETRFD